MPVPVPAFGRARPRMQKPQTQGTGRIKDGRVTTIGWVRWQVRQIQCPMSACLVFVWSCRVVSCRVVGLERACRC